MVGNSLVKQGRETVQAPAGGAEAAITYPILKRKEAVKAVCTRISDWISVTPKALSDRLRSEIHTSLHCSAFFEWILERGSSLLRLLS